MRRPSLRWALLGPVLVSLLVGIAGLGVYVQRNVRGDLVGALDDELTRVISNDPRQSGPPGAPSRPDDDAAPVAPGRLDAVSDAAIPVELILFPDGTYENVNGRQIPFDDAQLTELRGSRGLQTVDGEPSFRVLTVEGLGDTTDLAALSLEPVDDSISSLRRNLVLGGAALFLVQSVLIWWIAGRASRPVTRMSAAARRIAEGELATEVGDPSGSAETAALAQDLQRMLDRLRRTIDDREQAASDAEAARRDMQRFLADASHELRTPLTALRGYSELHAGGMLDDDEALDRAMARIGSESERMQRLVIDMLQVVRESTDVASVDLAAVVDDVADDIRAAHPERRIGIDVSGNGSTIVRGDAGRLHQAVLNLAGNACVHTPSDTEIVLRCRGRGSAVVVEVVDKGPGIDPGDVESMFRPFSRGDASRSRRTHDGAGLGLAIVARIVEEHGGSVSVVETPGGGATVRVELPAAVEAVAEPQPVNNL